MADNKKSEQKMGSDKIQDGGQLDDLSYDFDQNICVPKQDWSWKKDVFLTFAFK